MEKQNWQSKTKNMWSLKAEWNCPKIFSWIITQQAVSVAIKLKRERKRACTVIEKIDIVYSTAAENDAI